MTDPARKPDPLTWLIAALTIIVLTAGGLLLGALIASL